MGEGQSQATAQAYRDKAKKQEDRFKAKHDADSRRIAELEKANSKLEVRLQRAKEAHRLAEDGRRAAILDLNALVKDVEEQVAPAVEQAAEATHTAQAARVLTKQWERMFQALVARGNELAAQLGTEVPHAEVRGHGDAAMYLV